MPEKITPTFSVTIIPLKSGMFSVKFNGNDNQGTRTKVNFTVTYSVKSGFDNLIIKCQSHNKDLFRQNQNGKQKKTFGIVNQECYQEILSVFSINQ